MPLAAGSEGSKATAVDTARGGKGVSVAAAAVLALGIGILVSE